MTIVIDWNSIWGVIKVILIVLFAFWLLGVILEALSDFFRDISGALSTPKEKTKKPKDEKEKSKGEWTKTLCVLLWILFFILLPGFVLIIVHYINK